MRAFDRDLIRGGHYGQRSREPRQQAEHIAAPTTAAGVKKTLANPEPSTHGPSRRFVAMQQYVGYWSSADSGKPSARRVYRFENRRDGCFYEPKHCALQPPTLNR